MTPNDRQAFSELLVLRAQGGDREAVELIVRLWQERLLRHAVRMTGNTDGGGDVMQECWMAISRGLRSLEDPARFGPWAYGIVTRQCALWVRERQRRREAERKVRPAEPAEPDAAHETADELLTALRRLPADQVAVLEMRYLEEFSVEQIAEALALPPGTVKSRLFHARQQLRDHLRKEPS